MMPDPHTPPSFPPAGAVRVDTAEFYALMGPRNVHPRPRGRYDHVRGYNTFWQLGDGSGPTIGWSDGTGGNDRYWVRPDLQRTR